MDGPKYDGCSSVLCVRYLRKNIARSVHARMRWPKLRLLANRDANWGRALPTPSVYKSTQRRAQAHPAAIATTPKTECSSEFQAIPSVRAGKRTW